ncbi:MAG: hypothetical protein ISR51_00055 [Rhodospirillales bacterium]|nr:hypothetical protein [Alphaproteobacteria bacterium]MBL6947041.1 hypothetical protein [Rhodospirillales bacterium]
MSRRRTTAACVAALFFLNAYGGFIPFGGNAAWACGGRVEVAFFETDGDIFEITNKSEEAWAVEQVTIRLTGSLGGLIFDTEDGGAGASMAQAFEPVAGEVGLVAATPVGDGAEVMQLRFSEFWPGRRFEFIIDVDDRLESSDYGQAVVSGAEIAGAGAVAVLRMKNGRTWTARGRFGPDGRALLKGGVCA